MFFFFFFFILYLARSSSPKLQNIDILFLCKVGEQQTQFCLPNFLGATPPVTSPKWGTEKLNFWKAQAKKPVFFISVDVWYTIILT